MFERWKVGTLAGLALARPSSMSASLRTCSSRAGLRFGVDQLVHRLETFECVLAIEDAGLVEVSAFGLEDAASEATVDRCAADEHRDLVSTAVQFVDDERHLLGSGNQKRTQTNRGGVDFNSFGDDRLCRDLLAKVDHGVAVVGEDRFDEVLADVMYITVDSGNDNCAFGDAFHLFEIIFEMGNGLLHRFSRLKHEGQDQFARAKFIADFFHGGEEDVVQSVDGYFMLCRP